METFKYINVGYNLMKKIGVSSFLAFILSSFSVFALTPQEAIGKIPEWIGIVLKFVLIDFKVDVANETSVVFAKFILMIVIASVLYTGAKKLPGFENRNWLALLVALGITILGLQFITKDLIISVLLPSGAVAVTFAVLAPLMIAGFTISGFDNSAIRKFGWILLGISFAGLSIVRWSDRSNILWIYLVAVGVCGLMLWKDGTISGWRLKHKMDNYRESYADKELSIKRAELERLTTALSTAKSGDATKIKRQITTVRKQIEQMINQKTE